MCRDIEYITQVNAWGILTADGTLSIQGGFPMDPDEVVIRQILYSSENANKGIYLVRTNINNQIIGSVSNILGFVTNPETRIRLRSPLTNIITFEVLAPMNPPVPGLVDADDLISIHMDFIKYRR